MVIDKVNPFLGSNTLQLLSGLYNWKIIIVFLSFLRLLRGLAILNLLFAPLLVFLRNPPAKHQILQNEEMQGTQLVLSHMRQIMKLCVHRVFASEYHTENN